MEEAVKAGNRSSEPPIPSGTVTFVFTDIEGSTGRWERDRTAMARALELHDELVRAAIEAHGGHVFKTIGDAFCAAFSSAAPALAATLAAQRAIAATDWAAVGGLRVRMAVHTGDADERSGDYFGPVVNRVARLLSVGHGGQVLVSGVTASLVSDRLPSDASLYDLGHHRLKDLAQPEHVFQLQAPDLTGTFPALRSLDLFPNNLPLQVTSFIGRERETAEIAALLGRSRLVTLVGSGGIGKSRISGHVALGLLEGFGDGAWFVELAPIAEPSAIVPAIAQTLSLELPARGDPLVALVTELRSKRLLLVLDNCEHLIAGAAKIASEILRGAPNVTILASSRESLGVGGEATYLLQPLAVPPSNGGPLSAADAPAYAAVALFVARASAADSRFVLTDRTAAVVGDICRRLDGIALAIELAAPRVRVLSVEDLRSRIDERFNILTGGRRDALPRQQTLRATIDWSYDLLAENERAVLRRVGLFVNGCTLDAATAVACDNTIQAWEMLDLLTSLVDKSLLVADVDESFVRYRLLESTRHYALEKLAAAGERERYARRHAEWFADLAIRTNAAAQASFDNEAWRPIFDDIDNFRSAIAWAETADMRLAIRLAGAVSWHEVGAPLEGLALVERYEPNLDDTIDDRDAARLLFSGACCAEGFTQRLESARFAARGLALARACGDPLLTASCLLFTLMPILDPATPIDFDVDAKIAELRSIANSGVSRRLEHAIDNFEFVFSVRLERVGRARELADSMLARVKKATGRAFLTVRINVAEFDYYLGETDRAIALIEDCMDEILASRDRELARGLLSNLTAYRASVGDVRGAGASVRQALTFAPITPKAAATACFVLEHFALVLALEGDYERAARFAGFCDRGISELRTKRDRTEVRSKARLETLLRAHLDDARLRELAAAGAKTTLEAMVADALQA